MQGKIRDGLIFAAGAVTGAVVTWVLVKKQFQRIAQEEIDSVKAAFSKKKPQAVKKDVEISSDQPPEEPDIQKYQEVLQNAGYAPDKRETGVEKPYVIPPEEFGEFPDYSRSNLTLYADGVLTDENNDPVDDIEGTVGIESLSHFGEYEDDSIHVRNDARKSDYEILLDPRDYNDIIQTMPRQALED